MTHWSGFLPPQFSCIFPRSDSRSLVLKIISSFINMPLQSDERSIRIKGFLVLSSLYTKEAQLMYLGKNLASQIIILRLYKVIVSILCNRLSQMQQLNAINMSCSVWGLGVQEQLKWVVPAPGLSQGCRHIVDCDCGEPAFKILDSISLSVIWMSLVMQIPLLFFWRKK